MTKEKISKKNITKISLSKKEFILNFIMIFIILILCVIIANAIIDENKYCCCRGVVTRPCVCLGFIDCLEEACKEANEEMMPTCCNRYVNCTALKQGDRIIWNDEPGREWAYIEYINGERIE